MEKRVENILNILRKKGKIINYKFESKEEDEYKYKIECNTSKLGHKMWFNFTFASGVMRLYLTNYIGYLNDKVNLKDLAGLLISNFNSFKASSAFLSLNELNDNYLFSLQAIHQYLTKWNDEDIAEAISVVLLDLDMGILVYITEKPSLISPMNPGN